MEKPGPATTAPNQPLPDEEEGPASIFVEFWWFLRENKKWFLIPLIGLFLLLALLVLFGQGTGPISPFIYSLF